MFMKEQLCGPAFPSNTEDWRVNPEARSPAAAYSDTFCLLLTPPGLMGTR